MCMVNVSQINDGDTVVEAEGRKGERKEPEQKQEGLDKTSTMHH